MIYGLGFLLAASYIPGWTGATIISGWIVLSILLPFFLLRRVEMGPGHWLGLIFLVYATLGLLWTPVWQQGVWDLWQLYILAAAFCLGGHDLRKLWIGMALGLVICHAAAWGQYFGYNFVFNNNPPPEANIHVYAGTYVNPDMFGETACLLTIALIASRVYWPLLITIPPIYLTQSRSVYAAYAMVIAFALWERWRWAALIPCLLVTLGAGWWVTSGHRDSIGERSRLWMDTIDGITARGWGPGSFYMLYPKYASRTDTMATRPEDPHDEFLNLAFNYGLGAIPVLAVLAIGIATAATERYILVAWLAIALFSFPTRIPTEGFIGMVALGALCRRWTWDGLIERIRGSSHAGWAFCRSGASRAVESLYPNEGWI